MQKRKAISLLMTVLSPTRIFRQIKHDSHKVFEYIISEKKTMRLIDLRDKQMISPSFVTSVKEE